MSSDLVNTLSSIALFNGTGSLADTEAHLRSLLKDPELVTALLDIAMDAQHHLAVRQLAAVLFRRRIVRMFVRLPDPSPILGRLLAVTQAVLSQGDGEQVLPSLLTSSMAANVAVVERLLRGAGHEWTDMWSTLTSGPPTSFSLQIVAQVVMHLADADEATGTALLNVCETFWQRGLASNLTSETLALGVALADMAAEAVSDSFIESACKLLETVADPDLILPCLDIVTSVLEAKRVVDPSLLSTVVRLISTQDAGFAVRSSGLAVLQIVIQRMPQALLPHVEGLLKLTFSLLVEDADSQDPNEEEDDDEDDDESIFRVGLRFLDQICLDLPTNVVAPICLGHVEQLLSSPSPGSRRAGLGALAVMSEGCYDHLTAALGSIVPVMVQALDPSQPVRVRNMACIAFGHFAQHLQPVIAEFHSTILPALVASQRGNQRVLYALECMIEGLGAEELAPVLDQLMSVPSAVLQDPSVPEETRVLALTLTATIASSAEASFGRFVPHVLPMLESIIATSESHEYACRALELVSVIAVAMQDLNCVRPFVPRALERLTGVDDPEVRELCYSFFGNAWAALDPQGRSTVLSCAETTLESEEGIEAILADDDYSEGEEEEAAEGEDGLAPRAKQGITIAQAYVQEKVSALHMLAQVDGLSEQAVQDIVSSLVQVLQFPVDEVRSAAQVALMRIVLLDPSAANLGFLFEVLVGTAQEDPSPPVAAAALVVINEALDSVEPPADSSLVGALARVLQYQTVCQEDFVDADEETLLIASERYSELFDAALDVLIKLAQRAGDAFLDVFRSTFAPLLVALLTADGTCDRVKGLLVGAIADSVDSFSTLDNQTAAALFAAIRPQAASDEYLTKSNAAFAIGVLVQRTGASGAINLIEALQALQPLLDREAQRPRTADNAVSSVARIMMTEDPSLPMLECAKALYSSLPLQEDMSEAPSAYGGMFFLFQRHTEDVALPLVEHAVRVCLLALQTPLENESVTSNLVSLLRQLAGMSPNLRSLVEASAVEYDAQEVLAQVLTG
jgi:hypothetical protein